MRPLLLVADADGPERFDDADALARRIHQLRRGQALDVTAAHASVGGDPFAGVILWLPGGRYLGFAAGRDADSPAAVLTALRRTHPAARAA